MNEECTIKNHVRLLSQYVLSVDSKTTANVDLQGLNETGRFKGLSRNVGFSFHSHQSHVAISKFENELF